MPSFSPWKIPAWQYGVADGSPQNQRRSVNPSSFTRRDSVGREPELHGPPQVGVGEGIDLQHDQPATAVMRAPLAPEGTILYA